MDKIVVADYYTGTIIESLVIPESSSPDRMARMVLSKWCIEESDWIRRNDHASVTIWQIITEIGPLDYWAYRVKG